MIVVEWDNGKMSLEEALKELIDLVEKAQCATEDAADLARRITATIKASSVVSSVQEVIRNLSGGA